MQAALGEARKQLLKQRWLRIRGLVLGGEAGTMCLVQQLVLATVGELLMECGMHGAPFSYAH